MTDYTKAATRQYFPDGSSYNPNIGTVTFGLTLPVELGEPILVGRDSPNPKPILNCLARAIENSRNPVVKKAIKTLFDWIYDRATPEERAAFPNWFESQ